MSSKKNNNNSTPQNSIGNNKGGVQQLSFRHLRRQSRTIEIDANSSPSHNVDSDAVQAFDAGGDDTFSSDSRSSIRNASPNVNGGIHGSSPRGNGRLYQQHNRHHRESSSSGTNSDHHSATSPRNTSVTKLLLRIDETMEAKQQSKGRDQSSAKIGSSTLPKNHFQQQGDSTSSISHGASVGSGGMQREGSTLGSSAILSPKLQSGSLRLASVTTSKSSGVHGGISGANQNNTTPPTILASSKKSTSDGGDVAADVAGYTTDVGTTTKKSHHHSHQMVPPSTTTTSNNNHHGRGSMTSSLGGRRHPSAGSQGNLKIATHAINATHRMSTSNNNHLRRQLSSHRNQNYGGGHTPNSRSASPPINILNTNINSPLDEHSEGGFNSFLGEDELGSLFTPRGGGGVNDDDDTASLFSTYASAFPTYNNTQGGGGGGGYNSNSPSMKKLPINHQGGHYPHIAPLKVNHRHDVPESSGGRNRRKSSTTIRRKFSLIPAHQLVEGGGVSAGKGSSCHTSKKKAAPQSSSSPKVSKRIVTRIVQTTICLLISLAVLCIIVLVVGIAIMGKLQSTLEEKLVASLNTASPSSTTASSPSSTSSSVYVAFGAIISDSVGDAKQTFTRVGVGLVGGFVALVSTIAILWVLCYVLHRRRRQSKKLALFEGKKKAIHDKESATVFISEESNQNTPISGSLLLPSKGGVGDGTSTIQKRKKNRGTISDSAAAPQQQQHQQHNISVASFAGRLIDAFVSSSSSLSEFETESQKVAQSPTSHQHHRRSSATLGTPATTPHHLTKLKSPLTTKDGGGVSPGPLTSDRLAQILSNQDMASIFSHTDDNDEEEDPLHLVGTGSTYRGRVSPGLGGESSFQSGGRNAILSDDECESIMGGDSSMIEFLPSIGGGGNNTNNPAITATTSNNNNQKANLKLVRGTVLLVSMTNLLPATVASATTTFALPSNIPTWLNEEGGAVGLFVSKFEDEFYGRAANKPVTVPDSLPVKNPITALSSSQLSDIISCFVTEVSAIVDKFGGVIDCTSPTEIVATFNYHARIVQHEDVACRCALMIDSALREALLDWIRVVVVVSTGNNLVGLLGSTATGTGISNQQVAVGSSQSPATRDISQPAHRTRSKADKAFVSATQQATSHHRLLAGESLDLCRKIVPLCVHQLHARVIVTDTTLTKSDLIGIPVDVIEPHWETRMENSATVGMTATPQFQPALSTSPQLVPTGTFNEDGVTSGSIYTSKSTQSFAHPGGLGHNATIATTTSAAAAKTVTLYELVPGGLKKRKATAEVRDLTAAFLNLRRLKFSEARAKYAMYRFVNYQAYRLASFCEFMIDNIEQHGVPEGVTRYSRREIHWEDPTVATDAFSFSKGGNGNGGVGFSGSIVGANHVGVGSGVTNSPSGVVASTSDNPIQCEMSGTAQSASIGSGATGGSSSMSPHIPPTSVNGGGNSSTIVFPFAPRHDVPLSLTPQSISPSTIVRRESVPVIKVLSPSQWLALVCSAAIARDSATNVTTNSPSLAATASTNNVSVVVGNSSSAIYGLQQQQQSGGGGPRGSIRAEMLLSFGSMHTLGEVINNIAAPTHIISIPSDHPIIRYRQSLRDTKLESDGASLASPLQAGLDRDGNQMVPFAGWTSSTPSGTVVIVPGVTTAATRDRTDSSVGSGSTAGGLASGTRRTGGTESGDTTDTNNVSQDTTATVNRSGHHYLPAAAELTDPQTQSASDAYLKAIMGIDDVSSPTRQPVNPYHNNREVGLASPTMSWRGPGGFGSRRPSVSISETSGTGFRPTASNLRSHHAALNARNGGGGAMPSSSAATASLNGSTSSRKSLQQDLDDSHASIHITRRRIVELQAANQKKKQKELVEQVAEEDNALFSIFVDTAAGGDESANGSDTSKRSSIAPTGKRSKNSKKDKKQLSNSSLQNTGSNVVDDEDNLSRDSTSSSFNDDSTSSEGSVTSQGGACSPTRIKAFVGENSDIPAVIRDVAGHRYHLSSKCLGKGAFGEVFLAMDCHGTLLATKIFRLAAAAGNAAQWAAAGNHAITSGDVSDSMTPEDRQKLIADQQINANARATAYTLMNEVEVLAQLRHPNIASYVSCAVVGKEGQYFAMMMEFLSAGSLRSMMDDQHFGGILPASNFPQQQLLSQQPASQVSGLVGLMTPKQHPRAAVLSLAEALEDTDSDEEAAAAAAASAKFAAMAKPRKHRGGGVGGHRVLPRPAVLSYIKDILKGIAFLHEHQYVHCDIKPENVLLTAEGTCKLADFGTAKLMDDYDITGGLPNDGVEDHTNSPVETPAIGSRAQTAIKGGAAGAGRVWGGAGAPPSQPRPSTINVSPSDAFGSTSHLGVGAGGGAGSSLSSALQIISGPTSPSAGDIVLGAYTSEEEVERQRVLGAMVRGTPRYMAPEAVLGTFTPAADMFSLGVLVVELVTGEHPWAHVTGSDTTFMMRLARDETMKPKVYRHLFYTPRSRPQTLPGRSSDSDPPNPNSEQPKSTSLPWDASLRSISHNKTINKMPLDVSCSSSLGDEAAAGEDDDDFFFNLMNKADTDEEEDSLVAIGESPREPTDGAAAASGEWLTSSTSASTTVGLTREAIRRRSLAAPISQSHSGKKRQGENRKSNQHLKASNTPTRGVRDVERERRRKERRRQRRRMGQRYIDDHIGKVLFHVVRRCLHRSPEHRPSVHQLLEWLGVE